MSNISVFANWPHVFSRIGRPVVMIPTMYAATGLGAMAGIMLGMQASFARLTGYLENSVELAKAQSVPQNLTE